MALRAGVPNSRGLMKLERFSTTSIPSIHGQSILQPFDEPAQIRVINALVDEVSPFIPLPPLPDPGADDGAAITAAIAEFGYVKLLPGGIYNLKTKINLPPSVSNGIFDCSGAILVGDMAHSGGSANSLIFSNRIFEPFPPTTVADAPGPPLGQNILNVASGAGAGPGTLLEVAIAAGSQAVKTYFRVQARSVNQLQLDAPLVFPFVTGDPVRLCTRLENFTIIAEGTLFTGGGDRAISISGGGKIKIEGNFTVDTTFASDTFGTNLTGGVELIACTDSTVEEGCVSGWSANANADVFDIGFHFASCVRCTTGTLDARNCTVSNILTIDCAQCVFQVLRTYDSLAPLATGVSISRTAAANPGGCIECDYYSIVTDNFFNGFGCAIDGATRCNFYSYHGWNEGLLVFGFGHNEDLFFSDVTSVGSVAGAASGFNQGVIVGDAAHGGGFTKGLQIHGLRLIDCGTDTGPVRSTIDIESSITVRGLVQQNPTVPTTRGFNIAPFNAGDEVRFLDVTIETCPTGAGCTDGAILIEGEVASGAPQRIYIERATITLLSANDVAIKHLSVGILSVAILQDVDVLNPNSVATTSGYVGGTNTAIRRYGRVDFSATATPFTANQSNRGSFSTTGATPVSIAFADINAQEIPKVWMSAAAGTPAPDQVIAVTAGTGFAFTGKAADSSVRAYEI